jgi:hypothetical protein
MIEGVADYVRLDAKFPDSGWRERPSPNGFWDQGYSTTGYFLTWIEKRLELPALVVKLNASLAVETWSPELFAFISGSEIDTLWYEYQNTMLSPDTQLEIPPNRKQIARVIGRSGYQSFIIRNKKTGCYLGKQGDKDNKITQSFRASSDTKQPDSI